MIASAAGLVGRPARGEAAAGLEAMVGRAVRPMMERDGIPGMAIGVIRGGRRQVFNHGVLARGGAAPVTDGTLFEIGSVSKTFTATLACLAEGDGVLSRRDRVSRLVPALRGSAFDRISLWDLGTHTAGGLARQFPEEVTTEDQIMRYLRAWTPPHAPGRFRDYGNPGVGLLGAITARRPRGDFGALMARRVFRPVGSRSTWYDVPEAEMPRYAMGHTLTDAPIRLAPGALWREAYGIRTSAGDLTRFMAPQMGMIRLDAALRSAIEQSHVGYFQSGLMTQCLIWEQYRDPVALADLLAGSAFGQGSQAVTRLEPPARPRRDVLMHKTGSTNGFAAYVACVPRRGIGVVVLANKAGSIAARVTLGHAILTGLADAG